jgi:hypothetical protein
MTAPLCANRDSEAWALGICWTSDFAPLEKNFGGASHGPRCTGRNRKQRARAREDTDRPATSKRCAEHAWHDRC